MPPKLLTVAASMTPMAVAPMVRLSEAEPVDFARSLKRFDESIKKGQRSLLGADRSGAALGVLSHQVGDTRVVGVVPMPVWIRSVL
jgi:hypothetical protein